MPKAVQFDRFGPVDVLDVVDVQRPEPGPGEVLIEVVSTSINPGEGKIRRGELEQVYPTTLPCGEGADIAGRVAAVGPGVDSVGVGDEVIAWSDTRSAHAEFSVVPVEQVAAKPAGVDWDQAASLYVAGVTALACVRAVGPSEGDTVVVSAAAGGVGSIAVQLARRAGATVIGVAGPANADYLRGLGVEPVEHGDGLADRIRTAAPRGVDAFIDTYGAPYVELAVELGVAPQRINTIADFEGAAKHGTKTDGAAAIASSTVLAELAGLIDAGELVVPIARTYPLDEVRAAYTELEQGHTRGKIVLHVSSDR